MAQAQLPVEVLEAMLRMSGSPEEEAAIKEQLALAKALQGEAIEYNPRAPSHKLGGAAYAVGKGLLGYTGGKRYQEQMTNLEKMKEQKKLDRGLYMKALYGEKEGGFNPEASYSTSGTFQPHYTGFGKAEDDYQYG